jgi:hypothetical protein
MIWISIDHLGGGYIERSSEDFSVFTKTVDFWRRDIGVREGRKDLIFPFDRMGCCTQQLPRWFLPKDIFNAFLICEKISRIGL